MNIHFFRRGKGYYYIFEDEEYEVSEISINKLKEKLKLPFNVTFNGMSIAQIKKICGRLQSNNVECSFDIDDGKMKALFYERKHIVHAYCIPSKICLYGRNPECKPYILNTLGDKTVLMEVTYDYINSNDVVFYFLHNELSKNEQDFFSSVYRKLEIDYIYNITYEKKATLGRRRR